MPVSASSSVLLDPNQNTKDFLPNNSTNSASASSASSFKSQQVSTDFSSTSFPNTTADLAMSSTLTGGSLNQSQSQSQSSVPAASNIGIRTRHRSGTLPSKLTTTGNASTAANSANTLLIPPELGLSSVTGGGSGSITGAGSNAAIPTLSPGLNAVLEEASDYTSARPRMRSSSFQSSIWSMDNNVNNLSLPDASLNNITSASPAFLSMTSQSHSATGSVTSGNTSTNANPNAPSTTSNPVFNQQIPQLNIELDTLLNSSTNNTTIVPPIASNPNRIRSYSTNNVLLNPSEKHFLAQYTPIKEEFVSSHHFPQQPQQQPQLSQSQQQISQNQQQQQQQQQQQPQLSLTNAANTLKPRSGSVSLSQAHLDNVLRPRSQTFAAGLPFADPGFQQFPFAQQQHQNSAATTANNLLQSNRLQGGAQHSIQPILQDHLPESCISITSTHTNPSLGPTNTLLIINLPNDPTLTNSLNFYKMLSQFGVLLSVRIISCNDSNDLVAVVEFTDVESAMRCKAKMNYQELVPGLNCIVSFGKILSLQDHPVAQQSNNNQQQQQASATNGGLNNNLRPDIPIVTTTNVDEPVHNNNNNNKSNNSHNNNYKDEAEEEVSLSTLVEKYESFKPIFSKVISHCELTSGELTHLSLVINKALEYPTFKQDNLGRLPDPIALRQFDTPKLREIRKQLDSNQLSKLEIEELALAMHGELPELASDYLGNTIVQKLFETCDIPVRDSIIKVLTPYLAQMGAHKNGTWAAQKLINTIASEREKWLVCEALKPYCTQLFNDQYANYIWC
ncbi:unnamed protein product [Ambrosiozyma monospora]|uniref:Unnamed protein product n=1 Tax=Ambrosiozyma monospora TaxID=43982 RepID=A0ACB5T1M0_AMBMO|nr:unnamed protein product [Ambrosiozyma monospora]